MMAVFAFINFIWNDHKCKILFIIWLFKLWFYRLKMFIRKHKVVTDGFMTLRASNQMISNVWSYGFYDMTLCQWVTAMSYDK